MTSEETDPKAKRRLESAKVALAEYNHLVDNDPQNGIRSTLLNAYYRLPYAITDDEVSRCMLQANVARSNHGRLASELDRKKASLLDAVYERPIAARVTYIEYNPEADKKVGRRKKKPSSRQQISEILSEGFQRFVIRPWKQYSRHKELEILDMLLFAKGISMFTDDHCIYPSHVPVERVRPNRGATFTVADWEYCFHDESFPASKLWNMANEDERWKKPCIITLLRRQKEFQSIARRIGVGADWDKLSLDAEWVSQLETVEVNLLAFYVREWGGKITKRYMDPISGGKAEWVWSSLDCHDSLDQVVCCHVDDLGHGKYYSAPSYAQKVFLPCKEYDMLMNGAKNGAWLNSMLMLEKRGTQSRAAQVIRDHMVFEPGTAPIQHKFEVNIAELVTLARTLMADMQSSMGVYIPQESGKQTAYEKRADLFSQERVRGVTDKRWNECQTFELQEIYRRLIHVAKSEGKRPGDQAQKQFLDWCRDHGLEERHWSCENVAVSSVIQLASGEPSLRLERASRTLDILRIKPSSPGEFAAQRDAVAALNSMANVDDYMPAQPEFPDDDARIVGFENESLKDANARGANVPVLPSDPHLLHLFGNVNEGGSVIGHLAEAQEEVVLGLRMLSATEQSPQEELPLLADKINNQIAYVNNFVEHSSLHLALIAGDKGIAAAYKEATVIVAEIARRRDELVSNFGRFQEARMKRMQQQGAGSTESQSAAIKLQEAKMLADIRVAAKLEEAQAEIDIKRAKGAAEASIIRDKAAASLASDMVKDAREVESGDIPA